MTDLYPARWDDEEGLVVCAKGYTFLIETDSDGSPFWGPVFTKAINDAHDLRERNGRLEAALQFYADLENWKNSGSPCGFDEDGIPDEWDEIPQSSACADDRGETARAELAEGHGTAEGKAPDAESVNEIHLMLLRGASDIINGHVNLYPELGGPDTAEWIARTTAELAKLKVPDVDTESDATGLALGMGFGEEDGQVE